LVQILKKNTAKKLSKHQINELRLCADPVVGPIHFLNNYVQVKCAGFIPFEARNYQQLAVYHFNTFQKNLLLWSRQSGKTTVVAMYLLWDAMFRQGHDILITANTKQQATGEILDRINDSYEYVPEWLRAGLVYNAIEKKTFDTKSRLICRATTPGSARGTSPAILYSDEFAIIPSLQVQEEFFSSMLPAISRTKGKFIMSTTPLTDFDTFAKLWRGSQRQVDDNGMDITKNHWIIMSSKGYVKDEFDVFSITGGEHQELLNQGLVNKPLQFESEELASDYYNKMSDRNDYRIIKIEEPGFNGFKGHKVTCRELPDWSPEWEEKERASTDDNVKFDREYYLVFTGESEGLIESKTMRRIQRQCEKAKPLFIHNKVRYYKEIDPFCTYMVSLDPSMGVGKDYACMQIFELPGMTQVGEWMRNDINTNGQIKVFREILDFIHLEMVSKGDKSPEIFWSFENNTLGEAIVALIEELGEENFKGTCLSDIKKNRRPNMRQGFWVDGKRKIYGCNKLKTLAERGKIQFNSIELARQLSFFVQKGNSFAAKSGIHDDAVMAVICNLLMLERVAMWDENITEEMKDQFDELEPMPVLFEIKN